MKHRLKRWFQYDLVWILFIAITTALSSEIKLSPFSGEGFRLGMGAVTYLLLLIIRQPKNYLLAGTMTALIVITFRVTLQMSFANMSFIDSLVESYPGGVYYFIFILGFKWLRLYDYLNKPLILGLLASILEILSNSIEHILRVLLVPTINTEMQEWILLIIVAVFRSFFVVGLYSAVLLTEEKKRLEEKFTVGSGLYIETLYLQKSMNHIEQIMADSYELYRLLKKQDNIELSKKALYIAQEIHEVKKDSQRIYSGLSEITPLKDEAYYLLSEVLTMSIEGNQKYARHLDKEVEVSWSSSVDFLVAEQMLFMAVINNIVANAIEAIPLVGSVHVVADEVDDTIRFKVIDNGKGISTEDLAIIFEPGFTTKFNDKGVAATGIGLSHVQEAIKLMDGKINLTSAINAGTTFIIDLPKDKIEQRGVN